jgi:hypothetical protein
MTELDTKQRQNLAGNAFTVTKLQVEDGRQWNRMLRVIEEFSISHSPTFNPTDTPLTFQPLGSTSPNHSSNQPITFIAPVVMLPSSYNVSPPQTPSSMESPISGRKPSHPTLNTSSDFPVTILPTFNPSSFSRGWNDSNSTNSDASAGLDIDNTIPPTFSPTNVPSQIINIVERPLVISPSTDSSVKNPSDIHANFPTFHPSSMDEPTENSQSNEKSRNPSAEDTTFNPSSSSDPIKQPSLNPSSSDGDTKTPSFTDTTIPPTFHPSNDMLPSNNKPESSSISPNEDLSDENLTTSPDFTPTRFPSKSIEHPAKGSNSPSDMDVTSSSPTKSKHPSYSPSKSHTPTGSSIPSQIPTFSSSPSFLPSFLPSEIPSRSLSPSTGAPTFSSSSPSSYILPSKNETNESVESFNPMMSLSQAPTPSIQLMPALSNSIPQFSPFPYYNYTNIPITTELNATVAPSSNSSLSSASSQLGVGAVAGIGVGAGLAFLASIYLIVKATSSTAAVSASAAGTSSASAYARGAAAIPINESAEAVSTSAAALAPIEALVEAESWA